MSNTRTRQTQGGSTKRRRTLERFQVLNGFVDLGLARLTRSQIAVYLIIYRDTQPSGLARTSLSDLARRGGMSRRQASRALRALIGRGAVHVVRKGVIGKATLYSLYPPDVLGQINPRLRPWLGVQEAPEEPARHRSAEPGRTDVHHPIRNT
jgi:hypothetical protein